MSLADKKLERARLEEYLKEIRDEGDLRENSPYFEVQTKLNILNRDISKAEANEKIERNLPFKWKFPTNVGDTIVMGVKVYHSDYDKPVVILPTYITSKYQEEESIYICSTSSEFSLKYLGEDVSKFNEIIKLERCNFDK